MREVTTTMFSGKPDAAGSFKVGAVGKEPLGGGKLMAAAAAGDGNKTKKKKLGGKKENPYASRGLEKFSTVLAELESRREKVLRRVDGDRVLVRFVQSDRKGWVPIVVKLPPEELQAKDAKADSKQKKSCKFSSSTSPPPESASSPRGVDVKHAATALVDAAATAPATKKAAGRRWSWGRKAIRPSQYWPFVSVLLLVSLVVFGRVFAICCTSIWWYLVPILSGSNGGLRSPRRLPGKIGKELSKKASDNKLAAPPLPAPTHGKKISSGGHELISPRGQGEKR